MMAGYLSGLARSEVDCDLHRFSQAVPEGFKEKEGSIMFFCQCDPKFFRGGGPRSLYFLRWLYMRASSSRPEQVREDSSDADLFKRLIHGLSLGDVVRQHRDTDLYGNFIPPPRGKPQPKSLRKKYVSAFDDRKQYELTE